MILRRTIAAFVMFVLVGMFASPALAGVGACVLQESDSCCCADDESDEVATVAEPDCGCSLCACTLERADTTPPFYHPLTESSVPALTLYAPPPVAHADIQPLDRTPQTIDVRGPPERSHPPLYILHDAFLI